MLIDGKKVLEFVAPAPYTRYAKIFYDDQVITGAQLSLALFRFEKGQVGPKHVHEKEDEIYYCLRGKGTVTIDDEEYVLEEGCALYIPPKAYHETKNIGDDDFEFLGIFGPCLNMDNIRAWE